MKNQANANGGAPPELQAMGDPALQDISGHGPEADSLTSTTTSPTDTLSQGTEPGSMAPDSKKGGQV